MKILANDGISKSGILKLEKSGFKVITDHVNQNDLIKYINENNIEVIYETFPLEKANEALQKLKDSKIEARAVLVPQN